MRDGTEREAREANLPQWAQNKLDLCRKRLLDAREEANALNVTSVRHSRDNVWLEPLAMPIGSNFMPSQWRTARFYVNDDRDSWIEVRKNKDAPFIELYGADMLMALPSSGNVLHVTNIVDYIDKLPEHIKLSVEALRRRRAGRGRLE